MPDDSDGEPDDMDNPDMTDDSLSDSKHCSPGIADLPQSFAHTSPPAEGSEGLCAADGQGHPEDANGMRMFFFRVNVTGEEVVCITLDRDGQQTSTEHLTPGAQA